MLVTDFRLISSSKFLYASYGNKEILNKILIKLKVILLKSFENFLEAFILSFELLFLNLNLILLYKCLLL